MTQKIDGGAPVVRPPDTGNTSAAARAGSERSQPVAAASMADSVRLTGEAEGLQALERELGSVPAGIDLARVNALRSALADGRYQVDPQRIATRMLELDRDLGK